MSHLEKIAGQGPDLVFLHANAYPPKTYLYMLHQLAERYTVYTVTQRPLWEGSYPNQFSGWKQLSADLLNILTDASLQDVIAVGHSMGAVASWYASMEQPQLFNQLILIDPVFLPASFTRWTRWMPYVLKKKYIPMVKVALRRRNQWTDRAQAKAYFESKKVFQRFNKSALSDFINHGLKPTATGVGLAYAREWEARIYGSAPYIWSDLPKTKVKTHIIKAQYSDVISADSWSRFQNIMPNTSFYEMEKVGHLIPFEQPDRLVEHIMTYLDDHHS